MAIWAGPQFTLIHNQGYRPLLGRRYPRALGRPLRESWAKLWDAIGPELRRCLDEGMPMRHGQAGLCAEGGGVEQDAFSAFSLTPIREEDGRIVGVLNVLEATAPSARESRHAFLLGLADTLRPLTDPELVQAEATRMLGEHLGASRVDYAEVDADANTLYIRACYCAPGVTSTLGEHHLDSFGAHVADAMRSGRTLVLADTTRVHDLKQGARGGHRARGILSHVTVPLMSAGRLTAVLAVHQAMVRDWSAEEVALVEDTAVRTWDAVERARIEAALRQTQAQLQEGAQCKQRLLAALSHGLRNPLAPVKNSLYILDRAPPGGDQARRARQVIERQIDQLSYLVDELSDWTRMTNGEHRGGTIEASVSAGRVARTIDRLPTDVSDPTRAENQATLPRDGCRRVLVIEDNIDAANSLRELLELMGHVVAVAFDGPEGVSKARELHPDVVLCDIGLPGMDGHAVARAFRSDAELRDVHLVALTGYALPEDLERAAEAGFEEHIAKPPSLDKLVGVLGGGLLR
jgi:CheY-like chemotaxis protein